MKIYLHGILILLGAIVLNWLTAALRLPNWYAFFQGASIGGFIDRAIHLPLISAAWLLVGYPIGLGLVAKLANSIMEKK